MIKLKVCGMKYKENIEEVTKLHPDYLGFIFYEKSKRFYNDEMPLIDKSIKKVGVFVNESIENVVGLSNQNNLDVIQLHGDETVQYCQQIKKLLTCEVIKAFSIKDLIDNEEMRSYTSVCDYFLFDTKGKLYGGNGIKFDWNILKEYSLETPFFLSGGITVSDIERINQLNMVSLYGVDINSGFEIQPGLKDVGKIKAFKEKLN